MSRDQEVNVESQYMSEKQQAVLAAQIQQARRELKRDLKPKGKNELIRILIEHVIALRQTQNVAQILLDRLKKFEEQDGKNNVENENSDNSSSVDSHTIDTELGSQGTTANNE